MAQPTPVRPTYAYRFRCIGPACEDTCCQGWTVPIDQVAWEKYQCLPTSPLRSLIDASILRTPQPDPPAQDEKQHPFAAIRMNAEQQCPMLTADHHCVIQSECGEAMLSHTCHTYPRIIHTFAGLREMALALSCPEAARLVLLTPDLLAGSGDREMLGLAGSPLSATHEAAPSLPPDFWPIREAVFELVRNRAYPLWQRLFLLGLLCRRLDAIANGVIRRTVPDFLADFAATVASGSLREMMERLPSDDTAQLDAVLRLAGLMLHKSNVRPRFVECVQAFTKGIGNGPGATLESLAAQYERAHDRFYEPFFLRRPHILENYLVNTILRCQFPFGKDGMKPGALPSMAKEFALLTAQFALIKGLLIGVAGFHGETFSGAHVVHTVQASAKHFEHHPEFLKMAHALLVDSQMDGARGLAILLRNKRPVPKRALGVEIHPPRPRA